MSSYRDARSQVLLIGAGTIGLGFAALHLQFLEDAAQLTIHDTRPDLQLHIDNNLPGFLGVDQQHLVKRVQLSTSEATLAKAAAQATIIQEQGPENTPFKTRIWKQVEEIAPKAALLWSSTSGIAASIQSQDMIDKSRLLVVHPFNPPHIMPLLELVPSPDTRPELVEQTLDFWRKRGRSPVVIKKETIGFVANRLAFALLRESIHMVNEGVVTVEELDDIVTTSMGPRWSLAGWFIRLDLMKLHFTDTNRSIQVIPRRWWSGRFAMVVQKHRRDSAGVLGRRWKGEFRARKVGGYNL